MPLSSTLLPCSKSGDVCAVKSRIVTGKRPSQFTPPPEPVPSPTLPPAPEPGPLLFADVKSTPPAPLALLELASFPPPPPALHAARPRLRTGSTSVMIAVSASFVLGKYLGVRCIVLSFSQHTNG